MQSIEIIYCTFEEFINVIAFEFGTHNIFHHLTIITPICLSKVFRSIWIKLTVFNILNCTNRCDWMSIFYALYYANYRLIFTWSFCRCSNRLNRLIVVFYLKLELFNVAQIFQLSSLELVFSLFTSLSYLYVKLSLICFVKPIVSLALPRLFFSTLFCPSPCLSSP